MQTLIYNYNIPQIKTHAQERECSVFLSNDSSRTGFQHNCIPAFPNSQFLHYLLEIPKHYFGALPC